MNPQDIILSRHPYTLTVGAVRKLLVQKDDEARQVLADIIRHRLIDRYVTPLEHVPIKPADFRSGFLTMAACCLLIETFQCFRDGRRDTAGRGQGEAAFKGFFLAHSTKFPGIDGAEFYRKIRCGVLHQAQTYGRFRILRSGPIYDGAGKSINATVFLRRLKRIVEAYVADLRIQNMDGELWQNALQKLEYICKTIENE